MVGQRDFFPLPFGPELLPDWIKVDAKNVRVGILFHELNEFRTGHQSGSEETRRSRRLDSTQQPQ